MAIERPSSCVRGNCVFHYCFAFRILDVDEQAGLKSQYGLAFGSNPDKIDGRVAPERLANAFTSAEKAFRLWRDVAQRR